MMRRPQNYGYEPVAQSAGDLEAENDRLADELKGKISSLKSLTIQIGDEVRYQDKLLNDMDDDMSKTGSFMQNTLGKVIRLSKNRKGYTCYMVLFALIVFFILYLFLKFR